MLTFTHATQCRMRSLPVPVLQYDGTHCSNYRDHFKLAVPTATATLEMICTLTSTSIAILRMNSSHLMKWPWRTSASVSHTVHSERQVPLKPLRERSAPVQVTQLWQTGCHPLSTNHQISVWKLHRIIHTTRITAFEFGESLSPVSIYLQEQIPNLIHCCVEHFFPFRHEKAQDALEMWCTSGDMNQFGNSICKQSCHPDQTYINHQKT